jgi:hypothetical protein
MNNEKVDAKPASMSKLIFSALSTGGWADANRFRQEA